MQAGECRQDRSPVVFAKRPAIYRNKLKFKEVDDVEREESPLREAWGKSRWKRWGTRALSWMLVLAILMPPHGRAEYTEILPEGGLCVHHPAHTE